MTNAESLTRRVDGQAVVYDDIELTLFTDCCLPHRRREEAYGRLNRCDRDDVTVRDRGGVGDLRHQLLICVSDRKAHLGAESNAYGLVPQAYA